MIRVLLVDDHELMREGLRSILERERDVEVVGEAASGREAVELARTLEPDVVVMDVAMKDSNGIEATRQLRSAQPDLKVIALSSHSDSRYVNAMLDAGACGYVLKANAYDDLRRALVAAQQGKSYLSPTSPRAWSAPRSARRSARRPRTSRSRPGSGRCFSSWPRGSALQRSASGCSSPRPPSSRTAAT